MDTYDILAIIGAAAWLYPFSVWVLKLLTKTKVEAINHRLIEIGYTTFGPIINLNLAFSAEKKDAFIKNITLTLTHENNEKQEFQWEWFEEILLEMDVAETGPIPYKKNQKAIAIKVPTQTLIEKKVGFQQRKFQKEYSKIYSEVNQSAIAISENKADINQLMVTREFNEFSELFKKYFLWKVGKYEGHIRIFVAESETTFDTHFSFELDGLDIKTVEQNVETCKESLKNHFVTLDPAFKADWRWINKLDTSR